MSPFEALALAAVAAVAGAWVALWWARRDGRRGARTARAQAAELSAARASLAAREATLRGVLAAVQEAVVVLDPEQRVVAASESATRWFELAPEGRPPLLSAIRSADLRDVLAEVEREGHDVGPVALRYGGRLLEVIATRLPGGGTVIGALDRTDQERLERARRDLVANVSHDLRTPLASITLLAEGLLAEPDGLGPEAASLVQRLRSQVASLTHLANGLADLDRIESGRAPFRLEGVALRTMVDEALLSAGPLLLERDLRVDVRVAPGIRVLADRPHVVRLIVNLLDNARHASPQGATVEIGAAEEPGGDVRLWVADDGPGIAPSERRRVFERFYRGDRARAGTGSGLGLAIAKHIAEGHGGAIWIDDPLPGRQGATVCVRLLGAAGAA